MDSKAAALAELRQLMSFYFPRCIDPAGGFFDCFDPAGNVVANPRRHLVSCARMIVNHARVASVTGEPVLLEGAQHGLRFLRRVHRDAQEGGYAWVVEAGRPLDRTLHCYGLAFVLLAYARALGAGIAEARPWLAEAWALLHARFWEPGTGLFADEVGPDGRLAGYRGQNANMHVCEALIAAYEATRETVWLERASALAERVVNGLAHERGWIWEHFDACWQADWQYNRHDAANRYRNWGYQPGHQVEWAKLLLILERHQHSSWRLARARQLFDEALRAGWDEEFGGIVYALDTSRNWHDEDKYGWVQAEALAAAGLLAHVTGEAEYRAWFHRMNAYIAARVIEGTTGTWHRMLQRNGQPRLDRRALQGKSDYHSVGALCDLVQFGAVDSAAGDRSAAVRAPLQS